MKNFLEYLLEQMSFADAMKVFDIEAVPNKADLDKLYKKLALKNHPDLGGSEEKMKEINQAKDVLDKNVGRSLSKGSSSSVSRSKEDYNEEHKQYMVYCKAVEAELKTIDIKAYQNYLEKIFGVPFNVDTKTKNYGEDRYYYDTNVTCSLEFADKDREKVIYLFLVANTWDAFADIKKKSGLASPDKTIYKISMRSDIMVDGKKQVLTKVRYVESNETKIFTDPSILLPKARLTKIAGGEVRKNSKLSKRDFVGLFTTVFKGEHEKNGADDYFYFKTAKGLFIYLRRYTMMRIGSYQVYIKEQPYKPESSVYRYERKPKTPDLSWTYSIMETQEAFDFFKDFLKKLDTFSTKQAVYDYLKAHSKTICGYEVKD